MDMQTVALKGAKDLQAVIRAGFPSYKKHNAFVSVFSDTHGHSINSYWDGGSRDEYALVELGTLRRKNLPTATHPYFDVAARGLANTSDQFVSVDRVGNVRLMVLPPGFALVQAGTFCGKPSTAHVFLNSADMPKLLTA